MAKPELGSKHQCQNCGAKFFDLNKTPVVCPKCGTTVEVAAAPVATRTPQRAPAKQQDDEDERENENGAEVVSLEDADQTEDGKVEAAATDDDAEDDDSNNDDDDAFLEDDEDDDGDVSGLVDNDMEDDEER